MDLSAFTLLEAKHLGLFLPGLVSEEDSLGANQSLLEYCISPSQPPPSVLTPVLLELTLKICFGHWTNTLKIKKNGKERSLTDRASKLLSLTILGKQDKITKL